MPSSFVRRLVQKSDVEGEVVIDLTDRLAPYRGSDVRPVNRKKPLLPEIQEPEVWTPLDLDFLFKAPRPTH